MRPDNRLFINCSFRVNITQKNIKKSLDYKSNQGTYKYIYAVPPKLQSSRIIPENDLSFNGNGFIPNVLTYISRH